VKTVSIREFQRTCLRLLDEVGASGKPIMVAQRGKPVAQLVPVKPERSDDWLGAVRDRGKIVGDLVTPAIEPPQVGRNERMNFTALDTVW
jgi:prevent-host-death family protein